MITQQLKSVLAANKSVFLNYDVMSVRKSPAWPRKSSFASFWLFWLFLL